MGNMAAAALGLTSPRPRPQPPRPQPPKRHAAVRGVPQPQSRDASDAAGGGGDGGEEEGGEEGGGDGGGGDLPPPQTYRHCKPPSFLRWPSRRKETFNQMPPAWTTTGSGCHWAVTPSFATLRHELALSTRGPPGGTWSPSGLISCCRRALAGSSCARGPQRPPQPPGRLLELHPRAAGRGGSALSARLYFIFFNYYYYFLIFFFKEAALGAPSPRGLGWEPLPWEPLRAVPSLPAPCPHPHLSPRASRASYIAASGRAPAAGGPLATSQLFPRRPPAGEIGRAHV